MTDPDVRFEVKKITEIVLPPSKMTKQPKPDKIEEAPTPAPDTVEPDNGDNGGDDVDEDAGVKPVMLDVDDDVEA